MQITDKIALRIEPPSVRSPESARTVETALRAALAADPARSGMGDGNAWLARFLSTPQARARLAAALDGKIEGKRSARQKAALQRVLTALLQGQMPSPKVHTAKSMGTAEGRQAATALPVGVKGAFVPGEKGNPGTILLADKLSAEQKAETLREEEAEALAAFAASKGVKLARGDAGARIARAARGEAVSPQATPELYKAKDSDKGVVRLEGKSVEARFAKTADAQGLLAGFAAKGLKYQSGGLSLTAGDAANVVTALNAGSITGSELNGLIKTGFVSIDTAKGTWSLNFGKLTGSQKMQIVGNISQSGSLNKAAKDGLLARLPYPANYRTSGEVDLDQSYPKIEENLASFSSTSVNNKPAVDKALKQIDNRMDVMNKLEKGGVLNRGAAVFNKLSAQASRQARAAFEAAGGKEGVKKRGRTFIYNFEPSVDVTFWAKTLGLKNLGALSQTRVGYREQIGIDQNGKEIRTRGLFVRWWGDSGFKHSIPGVQAFNHGVQDINTMYIPLATKKDGTWTKGGDITLGTFYGYSVNSVVKFQALGNGLRSLGGLMQRGILRNREIASGSDTSNNQLPVPVTQPQAPQTALQKVWNNLKTKSDFNARAGVGFHSTINLSKMWREGNLAEKVVVVGGTLASFASTAAGSIGRSALAVALANKYGRGTAADIMKFRVILEGGKAAAVAGYFALQTGIAAARGSIQSLGVFLYGYWSPRPFGPAIGPLTHVPQVEGSEETQAKDVFQGGRLRFQNFIAYKIPWFQKYPAQPKPLAPPT